MANKRVVPGSLTKAYKNREGDFSPNLVGQQFTEGSSLLTLGNFGITTNLEPKQNRVFETGDYSQEYTLNTLNLTQEESRDLRSYDLNTTLNLDITDVSKYVYYGSFVELLRVTVENIITNWKGSLYITDEEGGVTNTVKNTVLGYSYNTTTDKSTFKIPTQFVRNDFELIHNDLGGVQLSYTDITNIKLNTDKYEIKNGYGQFPIVGYTGDTEGSNPYITIEVEGESFPSLSATTFGTFRYHLKPKDSVVDKLFFNNLDEFSNVILNRLTLPKYTATFEAPIETESGRVFNTVKRFTWPTTDGYNIDIEGSKYASYISNLLDFATSFDRSSANLITRRYVSGSITEFDTDANGIGDTGRGRKVNKLLNIYGREFDEIKKYTDALAFANTVTYNKKDNTPDELIKNLAKTLGFDTINSISDNELLTYISKSNQATFSGHSRELSTKEIDTELWRRLVINAWWLFRSKGTRKVIEFYIKLFGLNECLVNFDEYVYVTKDKINPENTFNKVRDILGKRQGISADLVTIDEDDYPIDERGFPRILPNTNDYYFQMDGFWYNSGTEHSKGNNPHSGPYDFGNKYFNKFTQFIDDFNTGDTVTETEVVEVINLFSDYNEGTIEVTNDGGKPMTDYGSVYGNTMISNSRVSDNVTSLMAGYTDITSRTGNGSFKTTINVSDDNCELNTGGLENCSLFEMDRDTGLVLKLGAKNNPSPDGRINIEGNTLGRECCELYGYEWDTTTPPTVYSNEGDILNENFQNSINSLFNNFSLENTSNFCYWCPQVQAICDFGLFFQEIIKQDGIPAFVDFLILEGYILPSDRNTTISEFETSPELFNKRVAFYTETLTVKYGDLCRVTQTDFEPVKKDCCLIRGGKWVDVNNSTTVNGQEWRCVMDKVSVDTGGGTNPVYEEVMFRQSTTTGCELNILTTTILNTDGTNVSEEFCNYWSNKVNQTPTLSNLDEEEDLTSTTLLNRNYYNYQYDDGVCRHIRRMRVTAQTNDSDKKYNLPPSFMFLLYENRGTILDGDEINDMVDNGVNNFYDYLTFSPYSHDGDFNTYETFKIPFEAYDSHIRVEVDKITVNGYEYNVTNVSSSVTSTKEYVGNDYSVRTGSGPLSYTTNYEGRDFWDIISEVLLNNGIQDVRIREFASTPTNNYRIDSYTDTSFRIEGVVKNYNSTYSTSKTLRFYVECDSNNNFDMGSIINGSDVSVILDKMRPTVNGDKYIQTSSGGNSCDSRWVTPDNKPIPTTDILGIQTVTQQEGPRDGEAQILA